MIVEHITVPTYITLLRLCAAPLVLPILFVTLLPFNHIVLNGVLAILFVLFSFTDFLDGFLARRYQQESKLGKALDPIADKFLIYSSLVGLLAAEKIFFFWVVVLIGRDLFMMGLRQIASQYAIQVPVSQWGKARTVVLMAYITFLIANPYQAFSIAQAPWWKGIELLLLCVALVLTLWSVKNYTEAFLKEYNQKVGKPIELPRDVTHQ